ncbi:MAG TPA: UDP-3-O-(3-hydroxymyristoyl)glucosamine N-acyltransferase [bacterium]
MEHTVQSLARELGGRVSGDGSVRIRGVNSLDAAGPGEVTFIADAARASHARASRASAVIVPPGIGNLGGKAAISLEHPKLAFARALELFYPEAPPAPGIHHTAVIGAYVELGAGVSVGPYAVIGDRVRLGEHARVGAGAVIGDDSAVGDGSLLGPNVIVCRRSSIGRRVTIHGGSVIGGDGFGFVFHDGRYVKVPQVGNVVIEDDVDIGCNVCIDRATLGSTVVRQGTKIDNLVQVGHNAEIGRHVIMAGQVGLAGSVVLEDYVTLGGKVGVVDHVRVGRGVRAGGGSIIIGDLPDGEVVWGFPARTLARSKRETVALSKLPELLKDVAALKRARAASRRTLRARRTTPAGARRPRRRSS